MTGPTQTSHEPTPDELEHAGTDRGHHPGDLAEEPHGPDDHGETHGHDDHAHASGDALGPWDAQRWGALVLGVALGLVVVICLVVSMSLSPAVAG